MTSSHTSFDSRPLTDQVDATAVRAFAAELRSRPTGGTSASTVIGIVVAAVVGVVMLPLLVSMIVTFASFGGSSAAAAVPLVLIFLVLAAVGVMIWLGVRNARARRYRLHRFAQANGMSYEPKVSDPPLPGMIFSLGRGRGRPI